MERSTYVRRRYKFRALVVRTDADVRGRAYSPIFAPILRTLFDVRRNLGKTRVFHEALLSLPDSDPGLSDM